MIDIGAQVATIEKIMELMTKHSIDEVSIDYLNIKKSKFKVADKAEITPQEILAKHLEPPPVTDPWDEIPADVIEHWSSKGSK